MSKNDICHLLVTGIVEQRTVKENLYLGKVTMLQPVL